MTLTAITASTNAAVSTTVPTAPATAPQPVVAVAPSDDSDKPHGHHGHGGGHGHVRQALMQALGDLQGNEGHGDHNVKHDIAQFMHTLFQAVKGESTPSTNTAAATTGSGARASFSAGLSALITEASQGKAPAALQSAFDRLATDLKLGTASAPAASTPATPAASTDASPGTALVPVTSDPISTAPADPTSTPAAAAADAAAGSTATSAATTATPPVAVATATAAAAPAAAPVNSLQALLSRLQQLLGYGSSSTTSSASSLGNAVNLTA